MAACEASSASICVWESACTLPVTAVSSIAQHRQRKPKLSLAERWKLYKEQLNTLVGQEGEVRISEDWLEVSEIEIYID